MQQDVANVQWLEQLIHMSAIYMIGDIREVSSCS